MYCKKCGSQLAKGVKYCNKCGELISNNEETPNVPYFIPIKKPNISQETKKRFFSRFVVLLISIALIVVFQLIGYISRGKREVLAYNDTNTNSNFSRSFLIIEEGRDFSNIVTISKNTSFDSLKWG